MNPTVIIITEVLTLTQNPETELFEGEAGWQVTDATIDLDGGDTTYDFLKSIIPSTIACHDIGHGVDMWYDDEFLYSGAKLNPVASMLAGAEFRGPVVLASVSPEGETIGLTPEQIVLLDRFFDNMGARAAARNN